MTVMNQLSLDSELRKLRGKRVFFDPLHGNNGDKLISMGARAALSSFSLNVVDDVDSSDAIVVTGGAGLSSVWGGAYEEVARYCQGRYASKPLVILPSTMSFEKFDLVSHLNQRTGPTAVFARESYTMERIQKQNFVGDIGFGIDDDMAFHLRETTFLKTWKVQAKEKHILIVERRDAEAMSGTRDRAVPAPSFLKKFVPLKIKRMLKIKMHESERSKSDFAKWSQEVVNEHYHEHIEKPIRFIDVSLSQIVSFNDFCRLIGDAAVVLSTRLHVGILAALLNKNTIVVPGCEKYGKIQGIYHQSMANMDHVKLVKNPST